ncbi:hypothetical protein [Streptomyces mangrovisoli]|uniref:Gram-positive cocci surface proteins LPxTG domain-containing protein n=1 Tax=Streptomyces mangrovisoli TaxID=1428628 RepID=A0A1J4P4T8_9ACTN|nr:hypothetical protein [Streptomyces mangrovisoli]OIJ69584.1 hypothetical protein WN71_001490 [Streptomyces mangrovisoli]
MSIVSRGTARRLLGTGAAAVALCAATVAAASGAWAGGTPGGDGWDAGGHYEPGSGAGTATGTDRCQFSLDGTAFYDSVKVDDRNLRPTDGGKVRVWVRTAGDADSCTASLASYLAHGATFATSGEQVFVDFDTVTVKAGQTDSLDIAVPDAGCFAQVDLYRGAVKFDGRTDADDGLVHGDLPAGPDHPVIKDKLIAAWNGGTKDCTAGTGASSPAPSASGAVGGNGGGSGAGGGTESATPSASAADSASGSPVGSASDTPSAAGSAPAAAASPNGGDDLAETGGGSYSLPLGLGAAALLAAGGALVVSTRRKRGTASRR